MTDIDYEPLPTTVRYAVRLGADDRPHMFRYEYDIFMRWGVRDDNSTWLEKYYAFGPVYFHRRVFQSWLKDIPHESTDTFEMFGRNWIVIEPWHGNSLLCVLESTYSHSLALFMMHWHLDMGMWLHNVASPLMRKLHYRGER